MKTTWDELMRYAPEREYPLGTLQKDEAAQILEKTMQKAAKGKRRPARSIRAALLAAAIAAIWFERLFGSSAALIEGKAASYDEAEQFDVTYPTYTEEEQAMIAAGAMQVPAQAEVAETGVSAKTDEFVFTLDSMLASKDTMYAILRIDAQTEKAGHELAAWNDASGEERERSGALLVLARNNSGAGRAREWKNGGMGMDILEANGSTAYALLTNNGGEFAPGDSILFGMSYHEVR